MPNLRPAAFRTLPEARCSQSTIARSSLGTAERPTPTHSQSLDAESGTNPSSEEFQWSQLETFSEAADVWRQQAAARLRLTDTGSKDESITEDSMHSHLASNGAQQCALDASVQQLEREEALCASKISLLSASLGVSQGRTLEVEDAIGSKGDTAAAPVNQLSEEEVQRRKNISKKKTATVPWNKGLGAVAAITNCRCATLRAHPNIFSQSTCV
jgi:hypothetical protein